MAVAENARFRICTSEDLRNLTVRAALEATDGSMTAWGQSRHSDRGPAIPAPYKQTFFPEPVCTGKSAKDRLVHRTVIVISLNPHSPKDSH